MNKTSVSFEKITPSQAKVWLGTEYKFDGQRPIRPWQVEYLSREMEKGRFMPTANIAFANLNGDSMLVNGQHTLSAMVKAGATLQLPVIRHIVSNKEEADELYAHYDIGMKRSFTDSVRVYGVSEKSGLSNYEINRLIAALRYIDIYFGAKHKKVPRSNEDEIDLIYQWCALHQRLNEIVHPTSTWIADRIGVSAIWSVALVTMNYQEEKATKFWYQVARNDNLDRRDPRQTLHKKLYAIDAIVSTGIRRNDVIYRQTQSRMAIHCWNKFYNDLGLVLLKESLFNNLDPVKINGTPFDGTLDFDVWNEVLRS